MADPLKIDIDFESIASFAAEMGATTELVGREMRLAMQASLDTIEEQVQARTPVNIGNLRGSIGTAIHGRPPRFWGEVVTSSIYGWPVERGRKVGKSPPVDAIKFWVIRKGIAQDKKADQVAFLIARAIGRGTSRGIMRPGGGARMFEKGFEAAKPAVLKLWDGLADYIVRSLAG